MAHRMGTELPFSGRVLAVTCGLRATLGPRFVVLSLWTL